MALLAACDKVPLMAPTQSTIALSVGSGQNGAYQVTATVIEQSGTPVQNGTMVTFTTSLGTLDPPEASTVNGKATTTFRPNGQSGTAVIGATSGAAKAETVSIAFGGAAAESVTLRAEPATVPPTGGIVQLIAVVTDMSGNPVPSAPVVFSSDAGQLSSSSVSTDATGEARASLVTSRDTVVKARVGTKEAQVNVRATTLPTVTLAASPASPIVSQPVTFTVTPGTPGANGNAIRNVTLDFGDGSAPASLGAITSATSVSHVYNRADTYTVTASVSDIAGQQTSNSMSLTVQRAVVGVSVSASAPNTQVGTPVTFTVTVTNPNNAVIQSVLLRFGDGGTATLPPTGGTQSKVYTTAGTYTVRAQALDPSGNVVAEGTTQIIVAPANAVDVQLDANPADPGITGFSCTANYPKTCNANLVGFGDRIQFTATAAGGFGGSAVNYTWNYGDGTGETTTSHTVDHVFTRRDTFVVTVRVLMSNGAIGEQRLTMIIQ